MWLWIWACVGRTFIPDIFFYTNAFLRKNTTAKKKTNTITQTRKHHHTTTTQTQPDRCHHKNTTIQHNTTNNTHTNTHIHRNTKTLKSVRSCLIPYVPAWQHVAITSQRPQKQVNNCSPRSIEKKKAFISLKAIAAACLFLLAGRSRSAEQDTDILFAGKIYSWYAKFKTTLEVLYKGFVSSILWRVCGLDQNRHRLIGLCPSKHLHRRLLPHRTPKTHAYRCFSKTCNHERHRLQWLAPSKGW